MDVYDPLHICNHTDEEGRYAYMVGENDILSIEINSAHNIHCR